VEWNLILERIKERQPQESSRDFKGQHQKMNKHLEKQVNLDALFPESQAFQALLTDIYVRHGDSQLLQRFACFVETMQPVKEGRKKK